MTFSQLLSLGRNTGTNKINIHVLHSSIIVMQDVFFYTNYCSNFEAAGHAHQPKRC